MSSRLVMVLNQSSCRQVDAASGQHWKIHFGATLRILSGGDCDQWSWHVDPKNVGWAELAVEAEQLAMQQLEQSSACMAGHALCWESTESPSKASPVEGGG